MSILLFLNMYLIMGVTEEGFELFDNHDLERIVIVRENRFYFVSYEIVVKEFLQRAYFRPQGNKLFVHRAPICAKKIKENYYNIEICKLNEPNDIWFVNYLDNEGHITIRDYKGDRCIGHGKVIKGLENMLFSVKCDDPNMNVVFTSLPRHGIYGEEYSSEYINYNNAIQVKNDYEHNPKVINENFRDRQLSGHNWPRNTFHSSYFHKNQRHHHVEHVRSPYFSPRHAYNY